MALFNGNKRIEGSRSNTALVKSGHNSPAEKWLLDPVFLKGDMQPFNDGVLFKYEYGGPGQEDVTIPKGRMVGVGLPIKDFVTKQYITTMTLPGLTPNENTVGMVPYNLTKDWLQQDRFGGNQPSIITTDYVTLPYIPGVEAETVFDKASVLKEEKAISVDMKMPWGAVIGAGIREGDYLKATPSGRLTKWDKEADSYVDVVGQILASDFNQEPWGWMKWVMWDESKKLEDDNVINRSGVSNLPSDAGYPYDPAYVEGNTVFEQYQSQFVTNPTGIPGLHDGSGNFDGFGKNDTKYTDIEIGETASEMNEDVTMAFQVLNYGGLPVKNINNDIVVKVGDRAITAEELVVDYKKGIVTIKILSAEVDTKVTASYTAKHFGTPSYLDFKGVAGSFHILLKK